jgi:hypothetical protein
MINEKLNPLVNETDKKTLLESVGRIYNFSSGFLDLDESETTELIEAMTDNQAEYACLMLEDYNTLLEFFGALNRAGDAIGKTAANAAGTFSNIKAKTGQALANTGAVLGGIPKFIQGAKAEDTRIKNELMKKKLEYNQNFGTKSVDELAKAKSEINALKNQRGIKLPFLPRLRSAEGYKNVLTKGAEASQIGKNFSINKKVADATVSKNTADIQKRNEVYNKMYPQAPQSPGTGNIYGPPPSGGSGGTPATSRSNAAKKGWVSRNANKQKQQQMQAQTNQTLINARAPQQFFNKAPGPKTTAKKPIPVRTTGYNKGKQSLRVRPNVKTKP